MTGARSLLFDWTRLKRYHWWEEGGVEREEWEEGRGKSGRRGTLGEEEWEEGNLVEREEWEEGNLVEREEWEECVWRGKSGRRGCGEGGTAFNSFAGKANLQYTAKYMFPCLW